MKIQMIYIKEYNEKVVVQQKKKTLMCTKPECTMGKILTALSSTRYKPSQRKNNKQTSFFLYHF